MKKNKANNEGETIINVLFAVLIISIAATVTLPFIRNSLELVRVSRQRVQALMIVESQIERIKSVALDTNHEIFDYTGSPYQKFCLLFQDHDSDPLTADELVIVEINSSITDCQDRYKDNFYDRSSFDFYVQWQENESVFKVAANYNRLGVVNSANDEKAKENIVSYYRVYGEGSLVLDAKAVRSGGSYDIKMVPSRSDWSDWSWASSAGSGPDSALQGNCSSASWSSITTTGSANQFGDFIAANFASGVNLNETVTFLSSGEKINSRYHYHFGYLKLSEPVITIFSDQTASPPIIRADSASNYESENSGIRLIKDETQYSIKTTATNCSNLAESSFSSGNLVNIVTTKTKPNDIYTGEYVCFRTKNSLGN